MKKASGYKKVFVLLQFFAKLWLENMLRICFEIFRFGISSKGLRIRSMENRKKVGRSEWSQDRRDAEDKEYRT